MRFWDNPEAPLVDVYWYFTDLPFLPFPTIFNSRDWCEDPWHYTGRGEVFGAPRTYNGMEEVAGLSGEHICGTQADFEDGPSWPPTGEPLEYDDDGIPKCCRRVPIFRVSSASRPAGVFRFPPLVSRTSSSSRPAALLKWIPHVTLLLNSGSGIGADVEYLGPYLAQESSGSRPAAVVDFALVHSGNVASCSRPAAVVNTTPAIAGSVTSGSSTATDVEIAECPVLAPSCATAVPTMVNLECGFFQVAEIPVWRKWILIPGRDYRFILDFVPSGAGTWTMWNGDDCSGLTNIFSGSEHPPHQEWDFTAAGAVLAWELGVPTTTGMVGTTKVIRLN